MALASQVMFFSAGTTRWAVDLGWVREIVAVNGITPLPNAIPALAGIINVRGDVVPVFDSGAVLTDREDRGGRPAVRVMILGRNSAPFGLAVDEVTRILTPDSEVFFTREADPDTIKGCRREFIEAFISDAAGTPVPVLAPERLAGLAAAGSGSYLAEENCL